LTGKGDEVHEIRPLNPRARSRCRLIASCMWLTSDPDEIEALLRQYLKEIGK